MSKRYIIRLIVCLWIAVGLAGCTRPDEAKADSQELLAREPCTVSLTEIVTVPEDEENSISQTENVTRKQLSIKQAIYGNVDLFADIVLMYHEDTQRWYSALTQGQLALTREFSFQDFDVDGANNIDFEIWSIISKDLKYLDIQITAGIRKDVGNKNSTKSPFYYDQTEVDYLFTKSLSIDISDLIHDRISLASEETKTLDLVIPFRNAGATYDDSYSMWSSFCPAKQNYQHYFDFNLYHDPIMRPRPSN